MSCTSWFHTLENHPPLTDATQAHLQIHLTLCYMVQYGGSNWSLLTYPLGIVWMKNVCFWWSLAWSHIVVHGCLGHWKCSGPSLQALKQSGNSPQYTMWQQWGEVGHVELCEFVHICIDLGHMFTCIHQSGNWRYSVYYLTTGIAPRLANQYLMPEIIRQ